MWAGPNLDLEVKVVCIECFEPGKLQDTIEEEPQAYEVRTRV